MKAYVARKRALAAALALLAAGGVASFRVAEYREVFPFAAWNFYAFVPNRQTRYTLAVRLEGERGFHAFGMTPFAPLDRRAYGTIQDAGEALDKGWEERGRALAEGQARELAPAAVEFAMSAESFDPLKSLRGEPGAGDGAPRELRRWSRVSR